MAIVKLLLLIVSRSLGASEAQALFDQSQVWWFTTDVSVCPPVRQARLKMMEIIYILYKTCIKKKEKNFKF